MLQKIFWFFVLIFIVYLLLIFKIPSVANSIEEAFWFKWFNNWVIEIKKKFDNVVTDIPTKDEISSKYTSTLSWATVIKNNVVNTLEFTKDQINNVRETLSWSEETYNSTVNFLSWASDTIAETEEFINRFKKVVKSASWIINTASWVIE